VSTATEREHPGLSHTHRAKRLISGLPGIQTLGDAAVGVLRRAVSAALQSEGAAAAPPADPPELLLDIEGRFWDPASPTRPVRGRLQWSRQKGTLALEELLRPVGRPGQNPLERVVTAGRDEMDVIAGRTVFGEPLCLMDCFVHQMKGAAVQHPQVWTVNATLLGVDLPPTQISRAGVAHPKHAWLLRQPTAGRTAEGASWTTRERDDHLAVLA
jgi:hypothetical protein